MVSHLDNRLFHCVAVQPFNCTIYRVSSLTFSRFLQLGHKQQIFRDWRYATCNYIIVIVILNRLFLNFITSQLTLLPV